MSLFRPRTITQTILAAAKTFPSLVLTGPRQSGKSTLLKKLFSSTHAVVSLEDPDTRMRAKEDPRRFLEQYHPPVIIDEIQYVPELLSYIKTRIDEKRKPGQWLFTGSQQFSLMRGVSQSLAGRIAVLDLLPFSYAEAINRGGQSLEPAAWIARIQKETLHSSSQTARLPLSQWLFRGGFPEPASAPKIDIQQWYGSYLSTYIERDVRNLSQVGDLGQFEQFLRMCAIRTGQLLNLSEMAKDIGISSPTAKRWLSILETSELIFLLRPYFRNLGKRLVKRPKLFFCDTALAAHLLGIHDEKTLMHSPSYGHLFETMVVMDVVKRFRHHGLMPSLSLSYLRTRSGLEIDLVIDLNGKLHLFEVKSGMTITNKHAAALIQLRRELPKEIGTTAIISASNENFAIARDVMNFNWKTMLAL